MSSAVYITLEENIDLQEWQNYCVLAGIDYSPNTIGGNVYYYKDVEIHFAPPEITVSTYWMGDLDSVARVAKKLIERFKGTYSCDPELESRMTKDV